MQKEYYGIVDILKLIFCIAITYVHCNNFGAAKDGFGWFFLSFSVSIGVAYFFVASGYFFMKKIMAGPDKIGEITKGYCIRLLWPLLFWNVVNTMIDLINAYRNHLSIKEKLLDIVKDILFHPAGAMWYVQALIIAILMWYVFIKNEKVKQGLVLGVIFYVIGSFANSSYYMVKNSYVGTIAVKYNQIFETPRNGIFVGFVLVGLGIYVAYSACNERENARMKSIIGIAIGAALLVFEVTVAANKNVLDNHSMFYSILALAPSIFVLALGYKTDLGKVSFIIRKYSTGIYYSHVPMIVIVMTLYKIMHKSVTYGWVLWITDVILCILLCTLARIVNNKMINRVMF